MSTFAKNPPAASIDAIAAGWVVRCERGLSAAEQAEFESWQAADQRHVDALARKHQASAAFGRPVACGQADLLLERLATRATRRRRRRVAAAAAALGVLFAGGLFWPAQHSAPLAASVRGLVILPTRQTLPDGSVVELKTGAEIAVDFSGPLRRVALKKGEAHFKVAKNPDRAFVVTASGVDVRAVGTAFSVELRGDAAVGVLVTEGRVAVDHATATPTYVDAGSATVVEINSSAPTPVVVMPVAPDEMKDRLAWRAPRLEFSEIPLADAVALMNRHSRVQFVIDDPALARLPVSGVFRADNTETFVRLLEGSFGIAVTRSDDTIRLRPAR